MYQMMDECFVGIIFSVFTEDKSTKVSRCTIKDSQTAGMNDIGNMAVTHDLKLTQH